MVALGDVVTAEKLLRAGASSRVVSASSGATVRDIADMMDNEDIKDLIQRYDPASA